MDKKPRTNQGYKIIEGCTIGSKELVIGHNPKAPNPYVCWYCKDGSDYYWGCYCNTLEAAREKLRERRQTAPSITSKGKENEIFNSNIRR